MTDQSVEEGAKVVFDVEVTGKPKTVKWYKNGREIKPDKRIRIEQLDDKSYRMVIGEATKDDEATYKVEAANDAGTVDCQAKLTVHRKSFYTFSYKWFLSLNFFSSQANKGA